MSRPTKNTHAKNAIFSAVVALLVFYPITGMVLKGYDFVLHWQRPLMLSGIVLVATYSVSYLRHFIAQWTEKSQSESLASTGTSHRWAISEKHPWILILPWTALLVIPTLFLGNYWISVANLALIYILLGLGLNIVVGLAGLLDLGYVAFYAVGAYGYALGHQYLGLGFWGALPFAAILAALTGAILGFPVLRMHGDYLAIVTLGFGEIVFLVLNNWLEFTGGPNGVSAPAPTFFGLAFKRMSRDGTPLFHEFFGLEYSSDSKNIFIYLSLFLVVTLVSVFVVRLKKMPIGRAWEALREDEIACRSLGINHVTVKLSAFSLGAMIGGIAGVFFAGSLGFVNPESFTFMESALILAIVVLGGLGSNLGVSLAAIVLTFLPEFLREFAEYRLVIFGGLMVLMMIWRPKGLINSRRPQYHLKSLGREQ